jgi:ribosomal-protein-alanine N-acetyltransferase
MQIIATTPQFIIRDFLPEEETLFIELFSDERLTKYLPKRNTEENREIFRGMLIDYEAKLPFTKWAIIAPNGDLIGFGMLKPSADETSTAELGYNIHFKYWNLGIATAMCKVLIDYGFMQPGLRAITAVTVKENVASQRVLEKAGLVSGGTIVLNGDELVFFKILKAD